MEDLKVYLDDGAKLPTKAHSQDAGLDIYTPHSVTIEPHGNAIIDTGVHIAIPEGYAGMLKSKSGLNVRHDITSEGLIDAGYTGNVTVKLYNLGIYQQHIDAGDKISQLVIVPITTPGLSEVKSIDELYGGQTERGNNGFGSSGK
jgi:dUTP pyrophosphatase